MKRFRVYLISVMAVFWLTSCTDIVDNAEKASTGGVNEILVITDNIQTWRGEVGDSIRAVFTQDMGILPRSEPEFSLVNMQPNALHNELFKKHHNILVISTDSSKTKINMRHDLWAVPQCFIEIRTPDTQKFIKVFDSLKNSIFNEFVENERNRINRAYSSKFKNHRISGELKKHFGLDMDIPEGYILAKIKKNFAWIRKETRANSMNILVYTQPYKSIRQLEPHALVLARNKVSSIEIPGPTENSYQIVADEDLEPVVKEVNFNGLYAQEMRGLWKVKNDFMGGGFISYSFVDENTQTLITLDGFAYAPKQKKAPIMRELEAMLWSCKLMPKK